MSFPRYPAYKDSVVEWLGDIPSHWESASLKRWYQVVGGSTPKSDSPDLWDGPVVWVTPADLSRLNGLAITSSIRTITEEGLQSCGTTLVPKGSVILSTRAPIGSLGIAATELCTNQGCKALVPKGDHSSRFLAYLLGVNAAELNIRGRGTTFLELSSDELGAFHVPFPPVGEQSAITNFLDRETAKIDALVAEQEQLITLLKEKRQAVISHAVTKGLDPSVTMKDSGVEWLGEVPAHWEVGAIKRFFSVLDSRRVPLSSEERSYRQGPYPYYGASGVIDYVDEFLFDEDLILVSEDGANLLSRATPIAFIARGEYWVNNHAHILKPCDDSLSFWCERIESIDLTPVITGAAQPKLTIDALANLPIAVPPDPQERAAIDHFLHDQAHPLQLLIDQAEQGVVLLRERRSALISAAVTGQIDVRGLASAQEQVA